MAVNLVELAKGYLTPDIIQKGASFVSESESATVSFRPSSRLWQIRPRRLAALRNSVGFSTLASTMVARSTIYGRE
jgi:hypothetical protein